MRGAIKFDGLTFAPAPPALEPPIDILAPARQAAPYVFASPHSGRSYSESFLTASALDSLSLRASEDAYVDELFSAAPSLGAPLLAARFPRAYVDANRDPRELDPVMFEGPLPPGSKTRTSRVAAGLGVVPRVVADGAPIYRDRLPIREAKERIAHCHSPYHDALDRLLADTRRKFGRAALIDCHSMPSAASASEDACERVSADVVLGDRFGASCSAALTAFLEEALRDEGLSVARNTPYAGGWSTERYGRVTNGVHAIQIEINRGLYLDERTIKRSSRFEALRAALTRVVARLLSDGADTLSA